MCKTCNNHEHKYSLPLLHSTQQTQLYAPDFPFSSILFPINDAVQIRSCFWSHTSAEQQKYFQSHTFPVPHLLLHTTLSLNGVLFFLSHCLRLTEGRSRSSFLAGNLDCKSPIQQVGKACLALPTLLKGRWVSSPHLSHSSLPELPSPGFREEGDSQIPCDKLPWSLLRQTEPLRSWGPTQRTDRHTGMWSGMDPQELQEPALGAALPSTWMGSGTEPTLMEMGMLATSQEQSLSWEGLLLPQWELRSLQGRT